MDLHQSNTFYYIFSSITGGCDNINREKKLRGNNPALASTFCLCLTFIPSTKTVQARPGPRSLTEPQYESPLNKKHFHNSTGACCWQFNEEQGGKWQLSSIRSSLDGSSAGSGLTSHILQITGRAKRFPPLGFLLFSLLVALKCFSKMF